jgi:GTP-binding protein EngB required for normal cell division
MIAPVEPYLLVRVAALGEMQAQRWRAGQARESAGGQAALRTWMDLVVRAEATLDAAASQELRIALMGRVKAGKSTLLNGILGRSAAATHMFEQTSAIHQITAAAQLDSESARIEFDDGHVEEMSPAELVKVCEQHRADSSFWRGVKRLQSNVRSTSLPRRLVFFDTPGVASLTSANARVATDFVDAADVIVWVFSSQELGNRADKEFLLELTRRERPVICIATRADMLSEAERSDVLEWFESEYPALPVPLLTGAASWSSDGASEERTRVISAIEAIARGDTFSKRGAARRAIALDIEVQADLELRHLETMRGLILQVDAVGTRLCNRAVSAVENALVTRAERFFRDEGLAIEEEVRMAARAAAQNDVLLDQVFGRHFNEVAMQKFLTEMQGDLQRYVQEEWDRALTLGLDELRNHASSSQDELSAGLASFLAEREHAASVEVEALNTTIQNGAVVAAVAATGYVAWFGANAAAISLGAATLSYGLPIIGVALLAQQGIRWFKLRAARQEAVEQAQQMVEEMQDRFRIEVIEGKVMPALRVDFQRAAGKVVDALLAQITGGTTRSVFLEASAAFTEMAAGRFDRLNFESSPSREIGHQP